MSPVSLKRLMTALDLEERILTAATLFAMISVFLPWMSGEWLGDKEITFTGFGFYTSFIGNIIFVLLLALLILTVAPGIGHPIIARRSIRDLVRVAFASQATVLSLAALSVLVNITYDYTRMNIRFGVYCTFIGSLIAAFYAFWKWQEHRAGMSTEVFHHPDDHIEPEERVEMPLQPPPPPPPPLEPEEHRIVP